MTKAFAITEAIRRTAALGTAHYVVSSVICDLSNDHDGYMILVDGDAIIKLASQVVAMFTPAIIGSANSASTSAPFEWYRFVSHEAGVTTMLKLADADGYIDLAPGTGMYAEKHLLSYGKHWAFAESIVSAREVVEAMHMVMGCGMAIPLSAESDADAMALAQTLETNEDSCTSLGDAGIIGTCEPCLKTACVDDGRHCRHCGSEMLASVPVNCDSCEMLMIQGVTCHESGCPNVGSRWDADDERWIKQRKCRECGCLVDEDDDCCLAPEPEIYVDGIGDDCC